MFKIFYFFSFSFFKKKIGGEDRSIYTYIHMHIFIHLSQSLYHQSG